MNQKIYKTKKRYCFTMVLLLLMITAFTQAQTLKKEVPAAPIAKEAINFTDTSFHATWVFEPGISKYYIDVATDSLFANILPAYNNKDVGAVANTYITILTANTQYYYRIRAHNSNGTSANSNKIAATWFVEQKNIVLKGLNLGNISWIDYDNDGDLDLFYNGDNYPNKDVKLYKNNNGTFDEINIDSIVKTSDGSIDWGDYDNDGDMDLLITGINNNSMSKIYQNNNSSFKEVFKSTLNNVKGSGIWGDYDNDGDLDIFLAGSGISKIYQNTNHSFVEVANENIIDLKGSTKNVWFDMDNDGDLDLIIYGENLEGNQLTWVYKNNENTFVEYFHTLPCYRYPGSVVCGDINNDGLLDIIVSGITAITNIPWTRIYLNTGSSFTLVYWGSIPAGMSDINDILGDYDNDGDLDLFITGTCWSILYKNYGDSFIEVLPNNILNMGYSSATWGDYDNDGDLDLAILGSNIDDQLHQILNAKIYKNQSQKKNTTPNTPTNLQATPSGFDVTFTWDKASDAETPQDGLNYNLYLYKDGDTTFIRSPQAFTANHTLNGRNKIVSRGKIQYPSNGYKIKGLANGTYKWSIQAIDAGYKASAFATEGSFIINYDGVNSVENKEILIFPNPVQNTLQISNLQVLNNAKEVKISICNIEGKELFVKQLLNANNTENINVNSLDKGMYILKIQSQNEILVKRFIKN